MMTFRRAAAFENDFTLWQAAAREAPGSAFARRALGEQLIERDRVGDHLADAVQVADVVACPQRGVRSAGMW